MKMMMMVLDNDRNDDNAEGVVVAYFGIRKLNKKNSNRFTAE